MKIITRKIVDLVAAEYNPRQLSTAQYEALKSSLLRFGVVDPIVVNTHPDRKDIIVGGHQRVNIWKDLGKPSIPTVEVNLPEAKERELNVRLNRNVGAWDWDELANNFDVDDLIEWGFSEEELSGSGFSVPDEGEIQEDEVPAPPTEAISERGRIYQLGRHRLMCGDSTDEKDVARLMDGEKANVIVIDPPYDNEELYGKSIPAQVAGQKLVVMWDFKRFGIAPHVAINAGWTPQYEFIWDCVQSWYTPNRPLARHKAIGVFGDDSFFDTQQSIIADGKQRKSGTVSNTRGKYEYVAMNGKKHIATVEAFPNVDQRDEHGHGKPVQWITAIFGGIGGVTYLDKFGGSGTTLIACEHTGRACRMMELDPCYCDVIVRRYAALVGVEAKTIFKCDI